MLPSIHLYDDILIETNQIDDVSIYRGLAAKLVTCETPVAE